MPKLGLNLVEQSVDLRSHDATYKLVVENHGAAAVRLLSVTPRIPEGATLLEVKSTTREAVKQKHSKLCEELTELLRDQIYLSSKDTREKLVELETQMLRDLFAGFGGFIGVYGKVITGSFKKRIVARRKKWEALFPKIEKVEDAKVAFEQWLADDPKSALGRVYKMKLDQLTAVEATLGQGASSVIATIEPESIFAETYVIKFQRRTLNPRRFSFTVDCSFSEGDKQERMVSSATAATTISPKPVALSAIAIIAGFLGVLLRNVIPNPSGIVSMATFTSNLGSNGAIAAAILALVFFNALEFTTLSDKFKMNLSWRMAFLVGILCGLAGDRMLAALKAIIGG
jgi:hypothetical protein